MLTPAQLKPFLTHEDRFVRHEVAEYFAESYLRDPDVLPLVLEAYERFGTYEDQLSLSKADQLAVGPAGLQSVLRCLEQCQDKNDLRHLNHLLVRTPPLLIRAHEAAIQAHSNINPETHQRLKRRCELAEWTGERLWQELQDFAARSDHLQYVTQLDWEYADDLVEMLAPHRLPDTELLCRLLSQEDERWEEFGGYWLECFLVDLAGQRGVSETIPILVSKYRIDTDFLLERVSIALARMQAPEAVRLIRAAFPHESWSYRNFANGPLGAIKHPESEAANLDLLQHEEDAGIRTFLCGNLCSLFAEAALEIVAREIEVGYDDFIDTLEERLLVVADVLGLPLPGGDQWRQVREQQSQRMAAHSAAFDSGKLPGLVYGQQTSSPSPRKVPAPASPPPRPEPSTWRQAVPIQREKQRVGRNDPCPCGSGKKFKKCCGGR